MNAIQAAWLKAGEELGVKVELLGAVVLVEDFGRAGGTICGVRAHAAEIATRAEERDAFQSQVYPVYEKYDRPLFVETLNDWGWSGSGEPPAWYSGAPTSE